MSMGDVLSFSLSLLLIAIIPLIRLSDTTSISFLWGYCGWHIEEMFRDFKLGGYRLEDCRASDKRFMAIVLLIAIAYLCASSQGQQLKRKALQKYIARPEAAGRPYRRHSFFRVGLAAHRWVSFWHDCQQQIQQLMKLNHGKIKYYLKGQKAMHAVLHAL